MNRTANTDVYTLNDYKAMGSMPHKLTTPLTISYKPNWLIAGNPIVNYTTLSTAQAGGPASGIASFPVASSGNTPCSKWLRCPTPNTAVADTSNFAEVGLTDSVLTPFPNARSITETAGVRWLGHDIIVDQDVRLQLILQSFVFIAVFILSLRTYVLWC